MKQKNQKQKQLSMAFILVPLLLTILSVSITAESSYRSDANISSTNIHANEFLGENCSPDNLLDDKRKQFTFNYNGIKWSAYFEDGKLVELFKDGTQVSVDDLEECEDNITECYEEFLDDMSELDVDMDELKHELKKLKIDLSGLNNIEINFDKEEFKESMIEMKSELKKGLEELKDLNINIDIDLDFDELAESLKNIKININGCDLDMANLKIEMSNLKKELSMFKYFMQDLKSELVSDGYIDDEDEDFSLQLNQSKMVVNGKRLSDKLHQKYIEMYEEHYGEELENEISISE